MKSWENDIASIKLFFMNLWDINMEHMKTHVKSYFYYTKRISMNSYERDPLFKSKPLAIIIIKMKNSPNINYCIISSDINPV